MKAETKHHILLHLVVLIFGFTGILGKLITIDSIPLVFWRTTLGGLVILVWLVLRGRLAKMNGRDLLKIAGVGLSASIGIAIFLSINGGMNADLFRMSSSNWLYIGVLAVVATSFAFIASTAVMKHLTPFTAAIVINLEPIYSIVLAVLIFGQEEVMGWEFYFGGS